MTARLLGLTALCLLLAAAVAITGERRGVIGRPLVVPGLALAQVTRLELARADAAPIVVDLGAHGAQVTAPVPGPADEAVVRDLVSALAAARADRVTRDRGAWQRAGLDTPRLIVRLTRGPGALEVRLGAAQPASSQVWLGVDGTALLVPAWVADALDRELPALRRRRPFAVTRVTGLELHGTEPPIDLVLAGDPLIRRDDGAGARVAARPRDRLLAALAGLELEVLVDGPRDRPVLTVRVLGGASPAELAVHGPCPGHADHVLVEGAAGIGCVPAAGVAAVRAAAAEVAGPEGIARAPLDGAAPTAITLGPAGGGEPLMLSRTGAAWQLARGGARWSADDDAVRALLEALARPATLAPVPPGPVAARWTVDLPGGAVEGWELRPVGDAMTVRRAGEPRALVLDASASRTMAALVGTAGGLALRGRTVLVIEPTALARVVATGAAPAELERGATLDAWQVIAPGGSVATPGVEALVDALATLRATAWLGASELGRVRRTLAITVDPEPSPGAQPTRHTIEIGAARSRGRCAARVDAGDPVELAAADCALMLGVLAR